MYNKISLTKCWIIYRLGSNLESVLYAIILMRKSARNIKLIREERTLFLGN